MTQDSPFGFGVRSRRALHKMKMHLTSEPRSLHLQQRQSCIIYNPDHFLADNMLHVLMILFVRVDLCRCGLASSYYSLFVPMIINFAIQRHLLAQYSKNDVPEICKGKLIL